MMLFNAPRLLFLELRMYVSLVTAVQPLTLEQLKANIQRDFRKVWLQIFHKVVENLDATVKCLKSIIYVLYNFKIL